MNARSTPNEDQTRDIGVTMTLTAPGCGMGDVLVQDVREKLTAIPTVRKRQCRTDLRSALESVDDVGGGAPADRHDLVAVAAGMKPLTLLLLRHARGRSGAAGLADIDRPLSARGRAEALDAADCIAAAGPACRCDAGQPGTAHPRDRDHRRRQTGYQPRNCASSRRSISATPDELLPPLRRCAADTQTVLMVGHNPGLSALAQQFMGGSQRIELRPAGLCRIQFEHTSWPQVRPEVAVACTILR